MRARRITPLSIYREWRIVYLLFAATCVDGWCTANERHYHAIALRISYQIPILLKGVFSARFCVCSGSGSRRHDSMFRHIALCTQWIPCVHSGWTDNPLCKPLKKEIHQQNSYIHFNLLGDIPVSEHR